MKFDFCLTLFCLVAGALFGILFLFNLPAWAYYIAATALLWIVGSVLIGMCFFQDGQDAKDKLHKRCKK